MFEKSWSNLFRRALLNSGIIDIGSKILDWKSWMVCDNFPADLNISSVPEEISWFISSITFERGLR